MSRAQWNWHNHTISTLVFVVVYATTTLITGSPRNHVINNYFHEESDFPRSQLMEGRRAMVQNEKETNFYENATKESVEIPQKSEFNRQSTEIHSETIESDLEASLTPRKRRNCTSCIVILVKQYPEICEIIHKIQEFQMLVPRIREVVRKRMGERRLDFKYMVVKGKSAMEQAYETLKYLANGIKKFVNFIGPDEKTLESNFLSIDNFVSKVNELNWWSNEKRPFDYIDKSVVENLELQNDEDPKKVFMTCASNIMRTGIDICRTLAMINQLNEILKNSFSSRLEEESVETSELAIKLHSDDLSPVSFLEAVQRSLFDNVGSAISDIEAVENIWRGFDTREKWSSQGKRYMVNENKEKVAEIFETPDFRVEFIAHDEIPEFGDASSYWHRDFMDYGDREAEKFDERSMQRVDYRSFGFRDDNAKQRFKSLTEGRPVISRRTLEDSPSRYLLAEEKGAILSSQHLPNSLRKNVPLHDNDYRQEKEIYKFLER